MELCKECFKEYKTLKGVLVHIHFKHHMNSKEYYNKEEVKFNFLKLVILNSVNSILERRKFENISSNVI